MQFLKVKYGINSHLLLEEECFPHFETCCSSTLFSIRILPFQIFAISFSLSYETTEEQIEAAICIIVDCVRQLKKMTLLGDVL